MDKTIKKSQNNLISYLTKEIRDYVRIKQTKIKILDYLTDAENFSINNPFEGMVKLRKARTLYDAIKSNDFDILMRIHGVENAYENFWSYDPIKKSGPIQTPKEAFQNK